MMFCDRQRGFTLLELLVAMGIFALMSVMAYGGLRALMDTREYTEQRAEQFAVLQNAMLFFQQDLNQVVARGVRDEFGDRESPFDGERDESRLLAFTRGNLIGYGQAPLRRVEYRLEEGKLLRANWPVLDRVQGSEPFLLELLPEVIAVELRFLGEEWGNSWPSSQEAAAADDLPRAVELVIATERWGEIRRVFPIAP